MSDESKIEALEERIKELEQKIEQNNQQTDQRQKSQQKSKHISRRQFLKKAGLGTIGIGALSLSPASALDIKSDNLSVHTSPDGSPTTEGLTVDENQKITIPNGDLDLNDNNLLNVTKINGKPANPPINLIEVDKTQDLPEPSTLSKPTIAYINNQDEYAGIFQQ